MKPALLALLFLAGLARAGDDAAPDPAKEEVPLAALGGWRAALIRDNGSTGVWTVKAFQVFPQLACPEVVGLDDMGRCWIFVSYSGKWTPLPTIEEKKWLGGLAHADVDPRAPGAELYTGGQLGNLYQVRAYPFGATDHRLIARFEGREIHTILAGELDPRSAGRELLVFTRPGALYRVTPTGPDGGFESELLEELPGRVRDALVLPDSNPAEIVTVSRAGEVALLRITPEGPRWSTIHRAPMGKGRVALAPRREGAPTVLYTSQDDGLVLRHERQGPDAWRTEPIYLGPQGNRGIAAGRFDADPEVETVAVFGYSGEVELLSRRDGAWRVETIFVDRDKGHWLGVAELDGRNATDELVGSGYSGRVFQLYRPPGYGLEGLPAAPAPEPAAQDDGDDAEGERASLGPREGALRVAVRARRDPEGRVDPLSYGGGFQTKSALYETLVRRDDDGRIVPGLAERWELEEGGRAFRFHLRGGARFHDGTPVDAESVRVHFRRWVDLPEHAWLGAAGRIERVSAPAPDVLRVELDRPYALLPDLCALNPAAVRGPGALRPDGSFRAPIGSGPFRFVETRAAGRLLRLATRDGPERLLELACYGADEGDAPLAALRAGELDLVYDGWYETVPRERRAALARDPELALTSAPGSSVWYLSFRFDGGPTSELAVRRRVQAAVDREQLVRAVEAGHGDPCRGWSSLAVWPAAAPQRAWSGPAPEVPLVLVLARDDARQAAIAAALARQLGRARLPVELRALSGEELERSVERGEFDLRLERTWGSPYDPELSLRARFLPPPVEPSASTVRDLGVDAELRALVERSTRVPDEAARRALHALVQRHIDETAAVVPLYAPRRLALARAGWPTPALGTDLYRAELEGWLRAAPAPVTGG